MLAIRRNQDLMPSLINEMLNWNNWNSPLLSDDQTTSPKMNVSESDTDYQLQLAVPGLNKENLSLSIDSDNNLVLEMQQQHEEQKQERQWLRREFGTMQFKQVVALPDNVKRESISAKATDGILTVTLPKVTAEERKALEQVIEIQ